jgi:hypothetical protein
LVFDFTMPHWSKANAPSAITRPSLPWTKSTAPHLAAKFAIADLLTLEPRSADDLAQATKSHAPSLYLTILVISGGRERAEEEYRDPLRGWL